MYQFLPTNDVVYEIDDVEKHFKPYFWAIEKMGRIEELGGVSGDDSDSNTSD